MIIVILILATLLRFWNLPLNPPGLTWDEASLGYNAYSILQTGRDEYGTILPLTLKSFGDWKPAIYTYFTIPFVAILGLNEWAVRAPSAIFGVASVLLIYFFMKELFKNKKLALLAALFLDFSPWHIQFSRPGFEANAALFFNLLASYLFIKKKFIISALIFGISLFTYQGSRLFVPLIAVALIFIYRKQLVWKETKIAASLAIIFFMIMIFFTLFGQTSRLATQNFFAYQRLPEETEKISQEDGNTASSLQFQILHGQWWEYIKGLTERYLIYFSPKMLFIEGDYSQRHSVPDLGALYYFSAFLIPLGLFYLIRNQMENSKIVFAWLLLAPLPAVFSRDLITLLRSINMVIPWVILEAAGFYYLIILLKKLPRLLFVGFLSAIFLLFTFNFFIFLDRYFIHAPQEYAKSWLYGYREIFQKWAGKFSEYDQIIITDTYGQPYIYYLFYSKYDPTKFQKQALLDQPGVDIGTVRKIDNIEFRHIYWPADRGLKDTLFVGPEEELPSKDILPFKEFEVLDELKFPNGESAFKVVTTL